MAQQFHVEPLYPDVVRQDDGTLIMAYYFPQYHIAPENIQNGEYYTDWDALDRSSKSLTPRHPYTLSTKTAIAAQDALAHKHKVGVFVFYHYWLDNTLVLNHPVELFMQEPRTTKFLLCWDNESGFLGTQKYDQPEKHAYQLLRYFMHPNYLTASDGTKPFIVYLTSGINDHPAYLERFTKFLALHQIVLKVGHHWQEYKNGWNLPTWSSIACEFGPHMGQGTYNFFPYKARSPKWETGREYWQGAITSWDSRPRIKSRRTHQGRCPPERPNGTVSPAAFSRELKDLKTKFHPMNRDKIVTIFAWNEWAEGAALEPSIEYGDEFIAALSASSGSYQGPS